MSISRKFQRSKSKYTLSQKIISAVTAAGFIMQPFTAFAGEIIKHNNPNTNLINDKVANIWADKVVGNAAVNVFDKFNLSANEIANMYFSTEANKNAIKDNLVNFVNSRIDINGTVNAVKDNKIGGNLFFLSKDGMAVGKSGVINTGSLYVMTPAESDWNKIQYQIGSSGTFDGGDDIVSGWEAIPVNNSGTITVLGKVNATNEVQMRAAKIGVGKNVDKALVDGVASGSTVSGSAITTSVTDFRNIVNTDGMDVDNVALQVDVPDNATGDIVLAAVSSVEGERDGSANAVVDVYGNLTGNNVKLSAESEVTFEETANTIAVGDIDLSKVTNKLNLGTVSANYATLAGNAEVNVGDSAVINAANDVSVTAQSKVMAEVGAAPSQNEDGSYRGFLPAAGVVVADVDNDAEVTVSGDINAGNKIDITANAETSLTANAADSGGDDSEGAETQAAPGSSDPASLIHAAVVVASGDTNAVVNLNNADITSTGGDVNIAANVNNSLDIGAQVGATGQSAMATAVAVVDFNGAANVNVNGGNIKGKNVTIAAENTLDGNKINVDNGIGLPQEESSSEEGGQESGGETTPVDELKDVASQIMSGGSLTEIIAGGITGKIEEATGSGEETEPGQSKPMNPFLRKIGDLLDVGASVAVVEESNNANVNINNVNISAEITKEDSTVERGAVDIHANTNVENTSMFVTGHANKQTNSKKKGTNGGAGKVNGNVIADAAVLYNKVDNDAAVAINGANISGKTVNINSNAKMQYNIRNMYNDLLDSVTALSGTIKGTWTDGKDLLDELDNLLEDTKKAVDAIESDTQQDDAMVEQLFGQTFLKLQAIAETVSEKADSITDLGTDVVNDVKAAKEAFDSVKENLETFKDTNNYINYYVHTESTDAIENAASGSRAGGSGFELGLAGSVNITNVNNASATAIGAGTNINAEEKAEIKADTQTETVSITGNAVQLMGSKKKKNQGNSTPSGSGNTGTGTTTSGSSTSTNVGVGGSVAVQDITGTGIVVVGEGVNVGGIDGAAAGEITIAADNTMGQQGIVYGSGESGGKNGIGVELQGMVNMLNGGSDSVVSIDDNVNIAGNKVSLTANNSSLITAITGGATLGNDSTAASVGAGLGMVNYDVNNMVVVGDNGSDADLTVSSKDDEDKTAAEKAADKRKEGTQLAKDLLSEADITLAENAAYTKGSINASELNAQAVTSGLVTNIAVEAAANTKSKNKNKQNSALQNLNNAGGSNNAANNIVGDNGSVNSALDSGDTNANNAVNSGNSSSGGAILGDGSSTNASTRAGGSDSTKTSVNVAGAGSVAINMLDGETAAIIDNVTINSPKDTTTNTAGTVTVNVNAEDSLFDGSFAGAAAINWFSKSGANASSSSGGQSGGGKTEVSVGGAAGVSVLDRGVSAVISNSEINNAGSITNTATKSGAEIAAGLGLAVAKGNGDGTNVAVGAAVSYNEANSDIYALMVNDEVSSSSTDNATNITNEAYNKDLQISGGISIGVTSGGNTGVGVGGTAVISQIDNDLESGIYKGNYSNIGNVNVNAVVATTQVSAGVAGAVSTGSNKSVAFGGAVNYSNIDNTNRAFIDGAGITANGNVVVNAGDTNGENSDYAAFVEEHGIDASGKTGVAAADTGYSGSKDKDDVTNGIEFNTADNTGSTIVNVATAVGISTGGSGGSGAAGVNVSQVNNDMNAEITNAAITAGSVTGQADTNTKIVSVAAGIGASGGKFGGAGSVSWDELSNNNKVNIGGSTINAGSLTANAFNKADIINVAGQLSGSAGVGAGVAMAYNAMNNTTGVYVNGGSINLNGGARNIVLAADNQADIMAITAGVSAASTAAVNATVAINRGANSTEAVIGNDGNSVTITGVKDIDVTVNDEGENITVAGGITAAGTAAVGAGVAYSDIGGSSSDNDNAQQKTRAEINNANITTVDETGAIDVTVNDKSKLTTVAAGIGASGTAAVQGASATALINKQVNAAMNNVNINQRNDAADNKTDVNVNAESSSNIITSADVIAASGTFSGGAGVAVNRIVQQTNASVNGGTMNVDDMVVKANASPSIKNIGIGAAAAGTAGVTGSVAVNMIQNNVTAHIGDGANITADGNIGVVATSAENIANYVGSAAVGGVGAGVGVSVSVNQIKGETSSTIGNDGTNTTVTAKGQNEEELKTNTVIADSDINNTLINKETVDMNAAIERSEENRSGVIVDASSVRDLKSFLINAGVAGEGAGVAGTVNINLIEGATNAGITDTIVNSKNGSQNTSAGNVFVNAGDYTNSSGFVGGIGGAGMGAGVGLSSDTNTVNRTVSAIVQGSDINADETVEIDADSKQGVSSFTVTAGIAGVGAGVAGSVSVTELENKTEAKLLNTDVDASKINVTAQHTGIINAGNVGIGAAGVGAGVGLSVGVLKDNSETAAEISGSDDDKAQITAGGNVDVSAVNSSVVKPVITAGGAGAAGVAGATSVNNINSKVTNSIKNAEIKSSGNINGTAQNKFTVDAEMGSLSGGGVGVGVGVTVNTIDSTVKLDVKNSTLNAASDVTLTADEVRYISQLATGVAAGGAAVGVNIAVTTVGQPVDDKAAVNKIDEANSIYNNNEGNSINDLLKGAGTALDTAGIGKENVKPQVNASAGGTNKDSQITVNIKNSTLNAGNAFNAEAKETDDIKMTLGSASAGAAAVAAGSGILNVHRNTRVNIDGGSITAADIDVNSTVTGETALKVYQGSVGVFAVNGAYAGVSTDGNNAVNINGTTLSAKDIKVLAVDNAKITLQAVGVAAGVAALGALAAEAANDSDVSVNMTGTTVTANEDKDDDESGKVEITTNKANTVTAQAVNTAGGAIGGAGMGATVTDTGSSTIDLTGNTMQADNKIDVNAKTNSTLQADVLSGSAGWFASGAVSIAKVSAGTADDHLKTAVTIGGGNTFAAQNINFAANSNITESMDMDALAISGYAALGGNSTTSEAYADATVTAEAGNTYKGSDNNAGNVSFNANNTVTQTADTSGISAAGLFATGTNIGTTTSDLKTEVNVKGSGEGSKVNNFNANASSYASVNNKVNGDGDAIADISPYAAKVDNNYTANTDVTIGGRWNTAGSFTAHAVNGMDIDLKSDAVRAAVIGGSGTWLNNVIDNDANVTVNANITTGGAQNYTAQNNVDYNGEIDGSGYGGLNVNATDYKDNLAFTAGVDITDSTLHGVGDDASITAYANTQGSITSKNSLKSAGVIPVALAFSDHTINYDHSVNATNSNLTTDKKDADITLATNDNTDVKLETIADTQGGVVGAASAEASNDLTRGNYINIDGESAILSTKDINLYAGADANGTKSSLDLQVLADAYNKTAIPVYTDPTVDNTMKQYNQIGIAGNVSSVRHINASAAKGTTTVVESAKEYKVWTGTGGEGEVASTAFGDNIKNEDSQNYINVTGSGSVKAGIHNKLDITIGGESSITQPEYKDKVDENGNVIYGDDGKPVQELVSGGGLTYNKDNIAINAGSDWFSKDDIDSSSIIITNGLMERYNEVMDYLQAYDKNSDAYKAYEAEKNLLLLEMQKAGMAEKADNGTLVPLDYIEVPAISLPDIVVSGGNINLDTDKLTGTKEGSIVAQGAPQLKITNNSDLYLQVHDLTISDNGGRINLTGTQEFAGTYQADGVSDAVPTITIEGTSPEAGAFNNGNAHPQADIGIFGDITNTAGDVNITNDNYNILINGNVSGRNITIAATKGNVTQQSSTGVLNVGNDPITRLQFSEEVAKKIQTYLYNKKQSGEKSFKNYQEYLNWLVNDVGITLDELGISGKIEYIAISDSESSLLYKVKLNTDLITGLLMTNEEAKEILDSKKTDFSTYVSYLEDIGASFSYDLSDVEDALTDESAGIIAGGNIYLDAVNINIGGLIQSGYGSYATELSNADAGKVAALDAEWQANQKPLTDADVMGNEKYLVNGGGEVFNTKTKVWDYEVKVYYNPSTGQLITEDVKPEGGNIQISGKVSSTGNGRIMAMDGTSDVSINTTAVDKDVKVNSISVNDITGLISITDKNITKDSNGNDIDGWVTEYKNGQWREYAYGTDATDIKWQDGSKNTYQPEAGTQFAWTGGVTGEVIRQKHYTEDFLFWGALAYNTSEALLDHLKQINVTPEETIISSNKDPQAMKDGTLITDGYKGGDDMFRIDWTYSNSQDNVTATDPSVKKEYDGTAGKIFGYGEYIYTWTETSGDKMTSTSGIKADNTINIGFLGNGEGNGDITVNTAQDMLLNGNISNATVLDDNNNFIGKGSVNLNSGGNIEAISSANINSDDVNITAANGVNVNHAAIGDSANINVTTTNGDIKFVSTDGNLNIEQMITGGNDAITAATGSVYLEAQGNIIDATTGTYAIKGQRIDLISNTGNIGSKDNALTILGGSDLYSSDTMASSVNAKAQGDIVLTQTDGNMRLGTIESVNGDAVLTVANGSFVDAHPSENTDTSSAQDKIDRWVEAGLIVEGADADSSEESAKLAKEEREAALNARADALANGDETKKQSYKEAAEMLAGAFADAENNKELQTAKDTYINEYQAAVAAYNEKIAGVTDQEQIDQINNDYKEIYDGITNKYLEAQAKVYGSEFTADEQQLISSYAEVSHSDNYGWSQNQLLYAIQDSVLNAEPGEVQTVDTPNVTANNITLNAVNGGIGIDADAKYIKYDELNNEEKLKILAAAKAGDLTWDNANSQVIVRQQQAITVSVKSQDEGETYGKVNVTGRDNVYLAGVKDTELNINGVETAGDIRLQGDAGVNVDGMLTGEDLTINGGTGNIMGSDFINDVGYVKTNVKGNVYANAMGDINIHHTDNLNLLAISTYKSANLKADGSILMYTDDNTEARGRINANIVNLEAGANIGSSDNTIRILDNGAVVNANAGQNIYLSGVRGDGSTGELVLGTIKGANLDVTSESDISLGRDNNEEDETVNSNVNVGSGNVTLTTNSGSITQTAGSSITADSVNASATENILLGSESNKVNNFVVNGAGEGNNLNGDVTLVSTANNTENTVKVDFAKGEQGLTVNGTVTVNALGDSTELNITGGSLTTTGENADSVTFTSAGSITANTTINSAADIVMNAQGAITNTGSLTAGNKVNVNTDAGDIELGGDVTAQKDVIVHSDKGAIEISGTVTATDNDVNITSGSGAITTTGAITGGTNVNVTTEDGAINIGGEDGKGNVTANNGNVNITSGSGAITTTGAITGGTDVTVNAGTKGTIDLGGSVDAKGGNVLVTTDDGYINTTGNITANKVVDVNTDKGSIKLDGTVTATTSDVNITSGEGTITTTGAISGGNDVNVTTASGAINIGSEAGNGNVTANNNINIDTNAGDITLNGKVNSINGFTHIAAGTYDDTGVTTDDKGNVTVNGEIASGDEVIVNAVNGSITVNGTTTANNGNVETTVNGDGNINLNGTVTASGDVTATVTGEGDITTGDKATVSGTNIIFTTNDGNITTGSNLTADKNVDLNVNTGNITFGGDVTANDGNITIDITGDGSLKDAENANNTLTAEGQEGSADSGNIIINLKGEGDVDLYDLYATNNARLDIANGNLTLHEINGELVAMQLRTEGKEMDVDKITAGTQIVLTGSDMSLDNIAQRPDADGMLVVTPDGAQADKPIDNFTIGNIQTNAGSGIRFDRLWVNNSDIHISEGQLWFDKLYVENMAHFSNSNMVAGIYGVPPVRDGSDSVYWINTSENRPESDLQAWQAGVGDWMYLRFTDDAIQESNGILLTLDEYDYVYDQRFTAENHLRWQHGRYLDEDWKQAYGYGLSLHNRYGLIDYQEFTETNAGADEVAVEA